MTGIDPASIGGIEERLDRIVQLLTAILTKGMTRKDAVLTLTAAGLAPKEIADILGLNGNQVSVVLYDARQATLTQAKTPKSLVVKDRSRGD